MKNIGDNLWYDFKGQNKKVTINKIGNKYYTVQEDRLWKINKSNLLFEYPNYSQYNIQFYEDEQSLLDKRLSEELTEKLRIFVRQYPLPLNLDQLQRVHNIIQEK